MNAWETGQFQRENKPLDIATKLAIMIPMADKYGDGEPELWACIIEMLNWSLEQQASTSKLIPMKHFEFVPLVLALSRRRETNAQLWGHLSKVLVTLMNT